MAFMATEPHRCPTTERGRHESPFFAPLPQRMPSDLAAVKGWDPSPCSPASWRAARGSGPGCAAFEPRLRPEGLPEGRSAPRNIGLADLSKEQYTFHLPSDIIDPRPPS